MRKRAILATCFVFLLTACGKTITGTYIDNAKVGTYKFQGSKVYVSVSGPSGFTSARNFTIDGDKLLIGDAEHGTQVFNINSDGTLTDNVVTLTKISD